jgi:hypothetical protein
LPDLLVERRLQLVILLAIPPRREYPRQLFLRNLLPLHDLRRMDSVLCR